MADAARKEKLAAAKKKLKKFQQKSGRTPTSSPAPNNRIPVGATSQFNGAVNGQNGSAGSASPLVNSMPGSPRHDISEVYSTPQQTPSSERLNESTERLHQLTRQMNGLLTETNSFINVDEPSDNNNSVQDLEKRNRELASLLQKHSQMNEQLSRQMQDMKGSYGRLQSTLDHDRKTFEDRLKRELGALKEQLQVHIQTIGILVAEKTELSSSVTQSQKHAEQRLEEIEELSGRLKASRQRVGDLEKSFTSASSTSHKHQQSTKELNKEVDRLKLELYKFNKSNEDFQQKNSELQGKLQTKSTECATADDQVLQLRGKLEMAQLHLQQIQNTGTVPDNTAQIDQLLAEKTELQAKVDQYADAYQTLTAERDQIAQQYQEYIDQLTTQTHNLQAQINTLIEEKQQYADKHTESEQVIETLRHSLELDHLKVEEESSQNSELVATVTKLQTDIQQLNQQYQGQVNDNQQLSRLVCEREDAVMELEMTVQRLTDSQVDQTTLLDNLQSDKTALSRAMAQNKELKTQLAELQNGFVKMSNENMELMTVVSSEQHTGKELGARLGQQEEELQEIRETLSRKEAQLKTLQELVSHAESRSGDTEHDDQLRSAAEQLPLVEALQRDLAMAQDTINALTNQNSDLKSHILQGGQAEMGDGDTNQEHLSASIRQLESERNQVLSQLREEQHEKQQAQDKLHQVQHDLACQVPATLNGDVINKAQFEALQHAMKQLEGKYTKAMTDKADYLDKVERLEHVVLQLQGESETIGEYVSLYQTQRSVLRQRYSEKEEYISRLARDREDMGDKLGQLQSLVMQLLAERNMLHAYHTGAAAGGAEMEPDKHALIGNHVIQPHLAAAANAGNNQFGAKLESSNLEDWPDYSSNSSEESQVEQIIGVGGNTTGDQQQQHTENSSEAGSDNPHVHKSPHKHHHSHTAPSPQHTLHPNAPPGAHNIPMEDQTAQRIMHLLSEIGHSNTIDRTSFTDRNFVNCNQCTGRLQTV